MEGACFLWVMAVYWAPAAQGHRRGCWWAPQQTLLCSYRGEHASEAGRAHGPGLQWDVLCRLPCSPEHRGLRQSEHSLVALVMLWGSSSLLDDRPQVLGLHDRGGPATLVNQLHLLSAVARLVRLSARPHGHCCTCNVFPASLPAKCLALLSRQPKATCTKGTSSTQPASFTVCECHSVRQGLCLLLPAVSRLSGTVPDHCRHTSQGCRRRKRVSAVTAPLPGCGWQEERGLCSLLPLPAHGQGQEDRAMNCMWTRST